MRTSFQCESQFHHRSLTVLVNTLVVVVLAATQWQQGIAQTGGTSPRPNVIVINFDDMGAGDFDVNGSQYSSTPNIDRLASQGTRFTQFYAGAPICSPSRAALFTGQYAARSGINSFLDSSASNFNRDNANNLSLEAPSMAAAFQDAGYATGHFGKWHLGGGRDVGYETNSTPSTNVSVPRIVEYGYDTAWTQFEGLANRIINVVDYGGDAAGVSTRPSAFFNGLNQSSFNLGTGGGVDQIVYLEREFNATFMVDRAIDFLSQTKQSDPNQPVFMNVWLDEVHTPHDPPAALKAKYNALYPQLPQESRDYLAVLEATDAQIGRLVDYIDQQGLGEETLIIVTADNGATATNVGSIGSAGAGLRGSKGDLFEGGFREPLIARWTGNVAANRVDDETVMWQTDLFPTLSTIAGIAAPENAAFDGEDMSTALLGVAAQARTTPMFWNMNRGTEDRHVNPDSNGAGANGQEVIAIRSGDWKLLLNARGTSPELYNIATDPGETSNLATQQVAITSQLASQALSIRYSTPSRTLPDAVTAIVQLKADDLAGLGNGATVASWTDAATGDSFNGSVTQSTATARPLLATQALNGKAVIQFDGNDSLASSTTNSLPSAASGITVFAVATGDTSGEVAERLAQLGSSSGAAGAVVGFDVSSSSAATTNGGAGFRYNNGASLYATPIDESDFHIVAWQIAPGQTYADATMYVDGTLPSHTFSGNSTNATGTLNLSGSTLELILGSGRGTNGSLLTSDSYTGQLAELLVFNEQLDIGQLNLVANYLSSEYDLPFAYQANLDLFTVDGLAWVGTSANFDSAWNAGDGAGGLNSTNTQPFASGDANLYLGNDGLALYDASTNLTFGNRINSLHVGTASSGFIVGGTAGSGNLVVDDNVGLVIGSGAAPSGDPATGDLTIGEDGMVGTVTWNSTGTLKVEGKLRIGQGGVGTLEQNAGVVTAGDVAGSLKFIAVGNGAGSEGIYRLNNGQFLPGGGPSGSQLRHLRIGYSGAVGTLEVGDGFGAAGSALIATEDDLYVGYDGGDGLLTLRAEGRVEMDGDGAPVYIGFNAGSQGAVVQTGGTFQSDGLFALGDGSNASGTYVISGGNLNTAADGAGTVSIGRNGGSGSLHVAGDAVVTHHDTVILADGSTGTTGRLELVGSNAVISVARLANQALGGSETISWVADASGVTSLEIVGTGAANDLQLQNTAEVSANTGTNGSGTLMGDGTALALDLAALNSSQTLKLIDNHTVEGVVGFFEQDATANLYEEGESITATGFVGSVTISYLGGDGNDVVLQLVAGVAGDYNSNGIVDAADYTVWRDNVGGAADALPNRSSEAQAMPVGVIDYEVWRANFGHTLASLESASETAIPEPATLALALFSLALILGSKTRQGLRRGPTLIGKTGLVVVALILVEPTLSAKEATHPNIVVVFIDDMGWSDLSCFGGKGPTTQNIDRLAAEGIRFNQFYVNAPICSPSRVGLTTGQYPQRWRINSYLNNQADNSARGVAQWLDPHAPILARELQRAGYATGHFGKWHMGGQRDVDNAPPISDYGFDHSLTNFEGMGPKLLPLAHTPAWDAPRKIWEDAIRLGGPPVWMLRSRITGGYVESAISFIDESVRRKKAFYINVWPDDVHSPFFPPLDSWADQKQDLYKSVLDNMDDQLGPLFDRLRNDRELRQNTLIVFCSDNGPEAGAGSALPLRGTKAWLYEGGVRSPLIVWGPRLLAATAPGTVNDQSVFSAIDINRSLYDLCGVELPADAQLDGENVADTLLGRSHTGRTAPLFWRRPPDRPGFDQGSREDNPDLACREGQWKYYVNYDGSDPQLYDLQSDVSETTNVVGDFPDVAKRLHAATVDWNVNLPPDAGSGAATAGIE